MLNINLNLNDFKIQIMLAGCWILMLFDPKSALIPLLLPWNRTWRQIAHYLDEITDQFAPNMQVIYWNLIQLHEAIQFDSAVHEHNRQDSLVLFMLFDILSSSWISSVKEFEADNLTLIFFFISFLVL